MNLIDFIIPFTTALLVITFAVVLLYQNFQKKLVELELEKTSIEAKQRHELLQNSIMVEEQERKRIAQDLHDDLGAVISIIKMNLMMMKKKQWPAEKDGPYTINIENLIGLSTTAIESIRNISHQLMPAQLELFGLVKTVMSVIENVNRSGGLKAEFIVKSEWPVLKWDVSLGIYRMIMELVNNTIKHAHADYMLLTFEYTNKNLIICFEDDGIGFQDPSQSETGLGLMSLKARAKVLYGQFDCRNGAKKGIKATITIPIDLAITSQIKGHA